MPLAETNVIIPQSGTGMMPIVNDQVVTLSDTLDFGYKRVPSSDEQQNTPTDIENVNDNDPSTLNTQHSTIIYDVLGRKIMTLNEYDLISNIHLPTGVYIVQRGSNTERMVIR